MTDNLPSQPEESTTCTPTIQISDLPDILKNTLMDKPEDRIFLLQLEKTIISFIDSTADSFIIGPFNSYYRLLSHQVAEYYGLTHTVIKEKTKEYCLSKLLLSKLPGYTKTQKPTLESLYRDSGDSNKDNGSDGSGNMICIAATASVPKSEPKKKFRILKRDISSAGSVFTPERTPSSGGTPTDDKAIHSGPSLEELRLQKEKLYEGLKSKIFGDTSDEEGGAEVEELESSSADIFSQTDTKPSPFSASPSAGRENDGPYVISPQLLSASASYNANDSDTGYHRNNTRRRYHFKVNEEYNQRPYQYQYQYQYQGQSQYPQYIQYYPKYQYPAYTQYNSYTIPNNGAYPPLGYNTHSYPQNMYPIVAKSATQPPTVASQQMYVPVMYNSSGQHLSGNQTICSPTCGFGDGAGQLGTNVGNYNSNGSYYYYYNNYSNANWDSNSNNKNVGNSQRSSGSNSEGANARGESDNVVNDVR